MSDNILHSDTHPKYTHDCENCEYQGKFNDMDMYLCAVLPDVPPTFVLRFGDKGEQYTSMSQDIADVLPVSSPMSILNVLYRNNVI